MRPAQNEVRLLGCSPTQVRAVGYSHTERRQCYWFVSTQKVLTSGKEEKKEGELRREGRRVQCDEEKEGECEEGRRVEEKEGEYSVRRKESTV